jgi:hypothetical protein
MCDGIHQKPLSSFKAKRKKAGFGDQKYWKIKLVSRLGIS